MTPGPAPGPGIGSGGDALKKVQTGDALRIPARAYNAFIDAAQAQRRRASDRSQQATPSHRSAGIVLVRNDSGSDQNRLAVLGIDAPIIDPAVNDAEFRRRIALSCVTPVADTHADKFVILTEPIPSGATGRAYAAGVCPVQINVEADGAFVAAEVADGQTARLTASNTGSATILWREGGTGVQWAVVRLGGVDAGRIRFGRSKADWTDSQSTLELTPCDAAGNDNGLADVDVYVQNDKTAFDPSTATVAGDSVDIGAKVAEGTIIPYVLDDEGDWIVPVRPHQVIVDMQVDSETFGRQVQFAWSWGWFATTTAMWVDVGDGFAVKTDATDETAGYLDDEIEVGQVAGQPHTWLGKAVDNTANDHKLRLYLDGPGPVEHTVTLGDGTIIEWDAKGLIVSIKGVAT